MDEVAEAIEKYHGLVPLVYDIEKMVLDEARPQDMPYAVYLKREADKVIARHKYKRCLAMADKCESMCYWFAARFDHHELVDNVKWELFDRWRLRWAKLADKFKEGNK